MGSEDLPDYASADQPADKPRGFDIGVGDYAQMQDEEELIDPGYTGIPNPIRLVTAPLEALPIGVRLLVFALGLVGLVLGLVAYGTQDVVSQVRGW